MDIHIGTGESCTGHICTNNPLFNLYDAILTRPGSASPASSSVPRYWRVIWGDLHNGKSSLTVQLQDGTPNRKIM